MASRAILAAALVVTTAGAAASAAPAPLAEGAHTASAPPVISAVPSPADVVRETGSWFSHGWTLELRPDGTGALGAWVGAFDGDRISLRLIPAPGEVTVAEITAIETVGKGALPPGARPGVGGLVTVAVSAGVRTAHVEWTSGAHRHSVDLCPIGELDSAAMEALRCGA